MRDTLAAVLFDLDDTLFPQRDWLAGAWATVAAAATGLGGVDEETFRARLVAIASEGSDRGGIIDRAMREFDVPVEHQAALVAAFLDHRSPPLDPFPGAIAGLRRLRASAAVGLVTDGDVRVQHDKLRALGLEAEFDVVVFSDEFGRQHRKPDPFPFRRALELLGVPACAAVFVGDRPDKDVEGPAAVGMRAIRVRTGEYRHLEDRVPPWRSAVDLAEAFAILDVELGRATGLSTGG